MESLGKSQGLNPKDRRPEGFCRGNPQPAPREYHIQYYVVEVQTLVESNPDILVRDVERMCQIITSMKYGIMIMSNEQMWMQAIIQNSVTVVRLRQPC